MNLFKTLAMVGLAGVGIIGNGVCSDDPKELVALKKEFEASSNKNTEESRQSYIINLVRLWEKYFKEANQGIKGHRKLDCGAVAHAISQLPPPVDSINTPDLLIGDWNSPRHGYRYNANGTWIMLPDCTTHGTWKITNNLYFEDKDKKGNLIYLLNKEYFIWGDTNLVYIYRKAPKGDYE